MAYSNLTQDAACETNSDSYIMFSFFFFNMNQLLCGAHICRQENFEKSPAGRAARAQLQGLAKQSANSNKGEPALKVLVIEMLIFTACLL